MLIRVRTITLQDIGDLDKVARLPISLRNQLGMKTICNHCGQQVKGDHFIGGFQEGRANMIFCEDCWDGSGEKIGEW